MKLDFDDATSLSLESQLERLALEANFVDNAISSFSQIVPSLTVKLHETSDSFKSLFDKPEPTAEEQFGKLLTHLAPNIAIASFLNYGSTLVSIPEGFKGSLSSYIDTLIKLTPSLYKETFSFIAEYNSILASFITNKEDKISTRDYKFLYAKIQSHREHYVKSIEYFFIINSDQSKAKLSTVISRFADLKPLTNSVYELDKLQRLSNLSGLVSEISKTVAMLDIIKKQINDKQLTSLNGNSATNISNGAYELAKLVEFVSIFKFKSSQVIATVHNIIVKLDEVVK
jgi:hypothetical protein